MRRRDEARDGQEAETEGTQDALMFSPDTGIIVGKNSMPEMKTSYRIAMVLAMGPRMGPSVKGALGRVPEGRPRKSMRVLGIT